MSDQSHWKTCKSIIKWMPIGSRAVCNPAPKDTDDDRLILVRDVDFAIKFFEACGFVETTGEDYLGEDFRTMRRGELSFIISTDPKFYERFRVATIACRELNVLDKEHRIAICRAILYGGDHA